LGGRPKKKDDGNRDETKVGNQMVSHEVTQQQNEIEKKRKEIGKEKEDNPPNPPAGGGDGDSSSSEKSTDPPKPTKRVRAQPVPIETCIELIPKEAPDWFRSIAIDWVEYRQSRKNYFDNEKSWLRQLKGMSRYPRHLLEKAVDDAIANQWQGWEQNRVKEAFKLWEERENVQYYRAS